MLSVLCTLYNLATLIFRHVNNMAEHPKKLVKYFCPSLLRLVDRLYRVIHKTQNTRTKVLPSATVCE